MNFNYSANDSNTTTTPDSSNEENHQHFLFLIIIPFYVIYFSAWIGKLLYKYFFNLEPVPSSSSKFVTMLLFFMYFWASDLFYSHFPCQFIISENFIPVIISQTFYIASTIFVCIYVFNIARKQENAVAPVFVIGQDQNQAGVETPQSSIAKLTKIGLKVNILSLIQLVPECPRLLALIAFYASDSHNGVIVKILHVLTLISLILVPILINRRLNHYSNWNIYFNHSFLT